jgi:peroxiredoxin
VQAALERKGGRLFAIAASPQADLAALVAERELGIPLLADPECAAIRAFGLLHPGAGPGGADIAVPAHFLLRADGSIAWSYVARRINDRPTPETIVRAVEGL